MNSETLNSLATHYLDWLCNAGWQSFCVATIILLLLRAVPRIPVKLQYGLLILAVIKFLLPPTATLPTGLFRQHHIEVAVASETTREALIESPIQMRPAREFTNVIPAPALNASALNASAPDASAPDASMRGTGDGDGSVSSAVDQAANAQRSLQPQDGDRGSSLVDARLAEQQSTASANLSRAAYQLSLASYLLLVHLAGSAGFVIWIAWNINKLYRLHRSSRLLPECESNALLSYVDMPVWWLRLWPVQLRSSGDATAPLAYGLIRPTIILPTRIRSGSEQDLRVAVLHEYAHIRRGDLYCRWVELMVCTLWWFNPVAWAVVRRIGAVREDCCDDLVVLHHKTSAADYCQALLRIARQSTRSENSLVCRMVDENPLGRRLRRLMRPGRRISTPIGVVGAGLLILTAMTMLPGHGIASKRTLAQQPTAQSSEGSGRENDTGPDKQSTGKPDSFVESLNTQIGSLELHRVTVGGQAIDENGQPISGATILLGLTSGERRGRDAAGTEHIFGDEIARTRTGKDGRYQFTGALMPVYAPPPDYPDQHPPAAELQLIGVADGHGMSWSEQFEIRPGPAQETFEDEGPVFFAGGPIDVQLTFPRDVGLHGTLRDERGQPVVGATVRLGAILDSRAPPDAKSRMAVYSSIAKSSSDRSNWVRCGIIPEALRVAMTDAAGRYRFDSVPVDARIGISFSHAAFPAHVVKVIETTASQSKDSQVAIGEPFNVEAATVREVQVRAVAPGSGDPLPNARFEVASKGVKVFQHESTAVAGANGIATLRLVPGSYLLHILPPANQDCWASGGFLRVGESGNENPLDYVLRPAVRVDLIAEDEQGVRQAGIAFQYTADDVAPELRTWLPVKTQGAVSEFVTTDADGRLAALLPEGTVAVRIDDAEKRWSPRNPTGVAITDLLDAHTGSQPPQLTLHLQGAVTAQQPFPARAGVRRASALQRGRFRYRIHNNLHKDASVDQFKRCIASLDTQDPSRALQQLKEFFGELPLADHQLVQDGWRVRSESFYQSRYGPSSDVTIYDGKHKFRFSGVNWQCDVNPSIGVRSTRELVAQPTRLPGAVVVSENSERRVESLENLEAGMEYQMVCHPEREYLYTSWRSQGGRAQGTWQLFPREYDGELLPTLVVKASFRDRKLDRAEVIVFDEIEPLGQVSGDSFALKLPAGTNVVDYRAVAPNEAGRRSRSFLLRLPTFDLARRMGQPDQREPVLAYGDAAPAFKTQGWIYNGREIPQPNFEGKVVLVCMLASLQERQLRDVPDLRRAAQQFAGNTDIAVVCILGPATSRHELLDFSRARKIPCLFALDGKQLESASRGLTRSAFEVPSLPVSIVVDQGGAIRYYGSHVGHVDGAAALAVKLLE